MSSVRSANTKKHRKEKLRAEEASLNTLNRILSAVAEYVFLLDQHGRYLFVSESAAQLLGLSQHDFEGKIWQEIELAAHLLTPFEEHRQAVSSTGQTVMDEMLYPTSAGERWFEYVITPMVDQQKVLEAFIVSFRDITERRHIAHTMRRLASIVESSSDAIISKDLAGTILSWNKGAELIYGYRTEEMVGKSIDQLIPPEFSDDFPIIISNLQRGIRVSNYETMRMKKDGTTITVSVTISPIRDARGTVIGASSIAHDITTHKHMEDALRESRDELAALNMALTKANFIRSQFLATMSHELRTPLASMMGFSEMLLEDAMGAGLDVQQRSNLESIYRNSKHLLSLINDVLDLSKIDAGRMVLDYQRVSVGYLLNSLVEEIEPLAQMHHLFLKTEVEEGIDCIETDPGKFNQLLHNLVSNAIKFTEQGGVMLTVTSISLSDEGGEGIAFAVKDTGIGIPPDIQERIFEAFYQADMGYTRKVGGTGLGLFIVNQLVVLLGGKITVESVVGQGSTFIVTLPLQAPHRFIEVDLPRLHPIEQPNVSLSFPPREFLSGQRNALVEQDRPILVVDDNPDAIALVENALQDMPFPIIGVLDPLQMMEITQKKHPRAILLDVMIPELNGWQLLHQLKDNPATASIPVVMLTVLTEQAIGYVLGADHYVIKPYKKETLRNTLRHVLKEKEEPVEIQVNS